VTEEQTRQQSKPPLDYEDFLPYVMGLLHTVHVSSIRDEFGGELILIYRKDAKGRRKLMDNFELFLLRDREILKRMLPQAQEEYMKRLFEKLRAASEGLVQELLAPIYEATGLPWDRVVTSFSHDDLTLSKPMYFKRTIKDGQIVYRPLKSAGGRPRHIEDVELERRIIKAVVGLKKRNHGRTPTLSTAAAVISKRFPITEAALKMRMKRAGLSWKEIIKVT